MGGLVAHPLGWGVKEGSGKLREVGSLLGYLTIWGAGGGSQRGYGAWWRHKTCSDGTVNPFYRPPRRELLVSAKAGGKGTC